MFKKINLKNKTGREPWSLLHHPHNVTPMLLYSLLKKIKIKMMPLCACCEHHLLPDQMPIPKHAE